MKLPMDLQGQEQVLLFTRRHWLYLYPRLAWTLLVAFLPAGALLAVVAVASGLGGTGGKVTWAVAALWILYWLIKAALGWYRYYYDVWVVTNQRIVDSTRRSPFQHSMASADLTDVEDIRVERSGLLQTLFDYGDVRCQTAGELLNFVLAGIPEPSKVLALVDASRDAARRELGRLPTQ